jgi:hypothetical protein
VFWRGGGRLPRAAGWAPTNQICCDRPRDWIVVRGSCIGDLPAANGRDASGALDACRGVGCSKSGLSNICLGRKKVDAQMPRGALSVARRLKPLETVLRGRDIVSRVFRCDSRKYMHIQAQYAHIRLLYVIYIQIPSIRTYTYIYELTGNWSNGQRLKQQYTCRYMHIHAYTCIYLLRTYLFSKYVYLSFIREYTVYTSIHVQGEKW